MTEFDDRIKQALQDSERELYDELDSDMGLREMTVATFSGRRRWLTIVAYAYTISFFGLAIFCCFKFAGAEELKPIVGWAAGTLASFMAMQALKLWLWMEMQRAGVLREIKRIELQVASLTSQLTQG